jgi:predicted PurR-regulated permease PerM
MSHKNFSILQHKDGSIKTRDEVSRDLLLYRAQLIGAPLLFIGLLGLRGYLFVTRLETNAVDTIVKFAIMILFYAILFSALGLYGIPELRSRIRELKPYIDKNRALPSTQQDLLETTTLAQLEKRITRSNRIAIIATLLFIAYLALEPFIGGLISIFESSTPSTFDILNLLFAICAASFMGYAYSQKSKRELAALQDHYTTIRHQLEADANQQGGLSISAQETTAGALTAANGGEQRS